MRLPATTYRHGRNQDRRGSNADVSPYCFTAHPVMGGETRHYTHLTVHCSSPVTLEGGNDKARIPQSRGFDLIRPTLTWPRRSARFNREGRTVWHRAPGHFAVLSSTSPWCTGMAGHSQGTLLQSLQQGSTKHHLKAPCVLVSSCPIKGQAGDNKQQTTKPRVKHSKAPHTEINISSNHLCTLFSLFETWARCPISQACNPYTSTSVQGNTKLSPPRWT
jgi:hypothetical protein